MPFFRFEKMKYRIVAGILMLILAMTLGCVSTGADKKQPVKTVPTQDKGAAGEPAVAAEARLEPENTIHAVDVQSAGLNLEINIRSRAKLTYTSIKQSFPFGIAVYLPGTGVDPDLVLAAMDDDRVSSIKASYADESRTTAKVEILLKQDVAYEVKEMGNDLMVTLLSGKQTSGNRAAGTDKALGHEETDAGMPNKTEKITGEPALLTGVSFETAENGRSDISVETSRPVTYDLAWQAEDLLNVTLYNTRVPVHHQRALETRYFNSAVERILPKSGGSGDSIVEIRIREKVPYRVVQEKNRLSLLFEPADFAPPVFGKARKAETYAKAAPPLVSGSEEPPPTDASHGGGKKTSGKASEEAPAPSEAKVATIPGLSPPTYTGEKIKLDFYDTDIKNVFRILKSVSRLNFAVDQDVRGKVTLSLENPVPWDQVLDLVLKMNGLGKKQEGNVVRIATMTTLKKEDQDLQEAIAAHQKAEEQKKSLEPLVTEYIPINYSDASADIQPHVTSLLTPDRGTISVDQRTNMIIVTDTQETVDRIEKMIYRLDTVTPQIMIEAKVVEVTKDFSRSIGVGWTLTNAAAVSSTFMDDYNVSVNEPSGEPSAGDFSFFRLFGSSVTALNAKLAASEEKGEVRIVSSPRILTLDNKTAQIKQGVEYAYLERDDAGGSSVAFKDIDLLLEVTPHVTPDKRISMNVFITKNDISGITATGAPTLATNEAKTELLVNNNDTVVIGGIVKTTKNKDNKGLPFLTGIPILGQIFGTVSKSDDRNELLIFLTPSIVQLEQKRNISSSLN